MKSENNNLYASELQRKVALVDAKETFVVAGRGTGKSTKMIACDVARRAYDMPGAALGIVGASYTQVQQRTLASTMSGLVDLGFNQDVHWKVGRPKKSWGKPLFNPIDWDKCISFFSGTILIPVSLDRSGLSNSYTFWKIYGDEAKTFNHQIFKEDVLPTLRGPKHYFPNHPHNRGLMLCTSMPSLPDGQWILDMKKRSDPKLVDAIYELASQLEIIKYKQYTSKSLNVKEKLQREIEMRIKDLNILRSQCVMYIEASTFSNIDILDLDYIIQQQDILEDRFNPEILNIKPNGADIMFYNSLRSRHYYSNYNYDYIDKFGLLFNPKSVNFRRDNDFNPNLPLKLSFDFGSRFNGCVVCQHDLSKNILYFINNFYVEEGGIIDEVVEMVDKYYQGIPIKRIELYYDNSGNNRTGIVKETPAQLIASQFKSKGWTVVLKTEGGSNPLHHKKYYLWDRILKEKDYPRMPLIRINEGNCYDLKNSMEFAPASRDKNGLIHKVKSSEQKLSIRPRSATHLSDAADKIIYDCFGGLSPDEIGM